MNHNLEEKLTAYALGELDDVDVEDIEAIIENNEDARRYVDEIRAIGGIAEEAFATASLGDEQHQTILAHANVESLDGRRRVWSNSTGARFGALAASTVFVLGLAYVSAGLLEPRDAQTARSSAADHIDDSVEILAADGASVRTDQQFVILDSLESRDPSENLAEPTNLSEFRQLSVPTLMSEGGRKLHDQDYDRALDLYEEVLVIDPTNEEATRKLAEATLGAYGEDVADMSRDLSALTRSIEDIDGDAITLGISESMATIPDTKRFQQAPASELREAMESLDYSTGPTPSISESAPQSAQQFEIIDANTINALPTDNQTREQFETLDALGIGAAEPKNIARSVDGEPLTEYEALAALAEARADPNAAGVPLQQSETQLGMKLQLDPGTDPSPKGNWNYSSRPTLREAGEQVASSDAKTPASPDEVEINQAYFDTYGVDIQGKPIQANLQQGQVFALNGANVPALTAEELGQLSARGYGETPRLADTPAIGYYFRGRKTPDQLARVDNMEIVPPQPAPEHNTETYDRIEDNPFKRVVDEPLSTFSIDVDTGSYANVRRFLRNNQLPPKDAVRIEELLNYFEYAYTPPANDDPFAAHVELIECPWNDAHHLMRIGLKGREVQVHTRPPANLVFLLDVSGSMSDENKLPLVRNAMKLLTQQLRPDDRVAIVTYAGASGLALPSTLGKKQQKILSAIDRLESGGSTNGGAGVELAYSVAQKNFQRDGVNRVILATDGDFNVGTTDRGSLDRLIEEKAKSGVFLTVLGVGEGNLKDAMMEQLADKGNGQYAYLDTEREAKKVLVDQVNGTLVTIAKDVKVQIDFNPANVGAYRLIGYENRVLAAQDFDDDTKDAGEIGAGHTVTALYEITPPGVIDYPNASGTQSRYVANVPAGPNMDDLFTVKLRHKKPDGDTSELLEIPITAVPKTIDEASQDLRFAAAVAAFGMVLRESPHRGTTDWDMIANLAEDGLGSDSHGYREEFMEMIQVARRLKPLQPEKVSWTKFLDELNKSGLRIISVDEKAGQATVYSEEHRRQFTVYVDNETSADDRAEAH